MTTTLKQQEAGHEAKGLGTQMPFDAINEPGAYVCNWTGHLLRVPEDSIKPGRSPLMSLAASDALFVTRISDNPFVTLTKARVLAADCDLNVNF